MASRIEDNPAQPPKNGDELRAAYNRAKQAFTEEDLQRYAQQEEGVPLAQVLAELEELERQRKLNRA